MPELTLPYGFGAVIDAPFADARRRTIEALAAEGFGILTEIDIASALRQKLGVDRHDYVILGACDPPLADRALREDPNVGLLLPCNVVVYAADAPGRSVVAAADPRALLAPTRNSALASLADEVAAKLRRVIAAVADGSRPASPRPAPTPASDDAGDEIC